MTELPADLTTGEKLLYACLLMCAAPDGCAHVGRAELAQMTGLSQDSIRKMMKSLRRKGMLGPALPQGEGRVFKHPLPEFITDADAFREMVNSPPEDPFEAWAARYREVHRLALERLMEEEA